MALSPADHEQLAAAARDTAAARGAAESAVAQLGAIRQELAVIRSDVARYAGAYVLDGDSPVGAVYIILGPGAIKVWVQDGRQMSNLLNRYPLPIETWGGREVANVPTFGPTPPLREPEEQPTGPSARDVLFDAATS